MSAGEALNQTCNRDEPEPIFEMTPQECDKAVSSEREFSPEQKPEPSTTTTAVVTKATPAPSLVKRRVTAAEIASWTPHQLVIRACIHCHTKYRDAGGAWVCEHYHEGL